MEALNFNRLASVFIPFTLTSGVTQFNMLTGGIPLDTFGDPRPDLAFAFVNPTQYDVRLKGFQRTENFQAVTLRDPMGWPIMARSEKGPFPSKRPKWVTVQAESTPGNPIPVDADFTGCFLEIVYGSR